MSFPQIPKSLFNNIWVSCSKKNEPILFKIIQKCQELKKMLDASWDLFIAQRSFYMGIKDIESQCEEIKATLSTTGELLNIIIDTLTKTNFIPRRLLVNGLIQSCNNLSVTYHVVLLPLVEDLINGNQYISSLSSSGKDVIFRNMTKPFAQFKVSKEQYLELLRVSHIF